MIASVADESVRAIHGTVPELPSDILDASQPTVGHDWGYVSEP
jgi:hypothetical protein